VGAAPFNWDSGEKRGKRRVWGASAGGAVHGRVGGDAEQPGDRRFYLRLIATGKPEKVTLTACMRKLVVILNTMVRDERPWHPQPIAP